VRETQQQNGRRGRLNGTSLAGEKRHAQQLLQIAARPVQSGFREACSFGGKCKTARLVDRDQRPQLSKGDAPFDMG